MVGTHSELFVTSQDPLMNLTVSSEKSWREFLKVFVLCQITLNSWLLIKNRHHSEGTNRSVSHGTYRNQHVALEMSGSLEEELLLNLASNVSMNISPRWSFNSDETGRNLHL